MQKVATLKPNAETKRSFIATERSFILVALHIYVNTKKVAIINDFWGFNEKERSYLHPPAKQITQTNVPPAEQTRIPKKFHPAEQLKLHQRNERIHYVPRKMVRLPGAAYPKSAGSAAPGAC